MTIENTAYLDLETREPLLSESELRTLGHDALEFAQLLELDQLDEELTFDDETFHPQDELFDDTESGLEEIDFNVSAIGETDDSALDPLQRLMQHDILPPHKQNMLAKRASEGDKGAIKELIEHNMRWLAVRAIRKYTQDFSLEDLIQEGVFGLIRAAEKFDYSLGWSYITYATIWADHYMQRAIQNKRLSIRMPVSWWDEATKLDKLEERYFQQHGHMPSYNELSEQSGLELEKIAKIKELRAPKKSFEAPIPSMDGGFGSLGDVVPDKSISSVEDEAIDKIAQEELRSGMSRLNPRQIVAISLRFGFDGNEVHTYGAIARKLGLTTESTRNLINSALRDLRELLSTSSLNVA